MARLLLYFTMPLLYLIFWGAWLWLQYTTYADNDPYLLETDYQLEFVEHRSQLLFSELAFPLAMVFFFLALAILRFFRRRIRPLLLLAQGMTLLFFIFRSFIFPDSYDNYIQGNEALIPPEYLEAPTYWPWLAASTLLFGMMIFVSEQEEKPQAPLGF